MTLSARIVFCLALAGLLPACSGHKQTLTTSVPPVRKPAIVHRVYVNPDLQWVRPLRYQGEQWTLNKVVQTYSDYIEHKFNYYFTEAKISYPPKEIVFVALKQEKKLELWARDDGEFRFIREYFIMAASGDSGPKLKQGDRQVPEGVYRIVDLNPNSHYHLSMKLDYPNEFDRIHARREGRKEPGGDIYIHGKSASIGCLALGDASIEELFVLVAKVGIDKVKVVIAPHDPRVYPLNAYSDQLPSWTPELYSMITREIFALPARGKAVRTDLFAKPYANSSSKPFINSK